MKLGPMTRKWLVTIIVAIVVALLAVWLYTAYASEEVEPEVPAEQSGLVEPRPETPHGRGATEPLLAPGAAGATPLTAPIPPAAA